MVAVPDKEGEDEAEADAEHEDSAGLDGKIGVYPLLFTVIVTLSTTTWIRVPLQVLCEQVVRRVVVLFRGRRSEPSLRAAWRLGCAAWHRLWQLLLAGYRVFLSSSLWLALKAPESFS